MKKTILKTNHRISNHFSKTFFILLMLGIYSTGHAMLGNPIGVGGGPGGNPIPIGSGSGVSAVGGDLTLMDPQLTPPCNVSNTCVETDKYIPVWRWNATSRVMDACPSPLFVRKDAFTCDRMLRINLHESGFNIGTSWINPSLCPSCNIGFVGINATQPEEQLHVIGNVKCQEGKFIGKISTGGIYGELQSDLDGIPYSGDETYGTIEVNNSMNFNNGFTAGNATITDLSVSNLTAGSMSVSSLNLNSLTIGAKKPSGTFFNKYKLAVDGTIIAQEMITQSKFWADKVFHKGYKLYSLKELEEFITTHKHLPEIPSEKEILENGIAIDDMLRLQMQKIEELTLYVIQQQKEIDALKKKIK